VDLCLKDTWCEGEHWVQQVHHSEKWRNLVNSVVDYGSRTCSSFLDQLNS